MGIKNRIYQGYKYFLTLTVIEWIDIFTRPIYKQVIIESLSYCQKEKGLILYAWCVMSNHIHLIAEAKEGKKLSDILRDFKKHTSKKILQAIKEYPESRRDWILNIFKYAGRYNKKIKHYKFWQNGNEAKEIHSNEFMEQKLEYIHMNPVIAEIVEFPEDYLYSSARDYVGNKGLLEIIKIE